MKAEDMLDYLIDQMTKLLEGKEIDQEEFHKVCRDTEARQELKTILEQEEE